MTKKTLILSFSALFVALAACGSVLAVRADGEETDETLVKLESGTQYEISNTSDEFIVRVAVTLRAGIRSVKPLLVDAAIGDMHDQTLAQSFNVGMENVQNGENRLPALIIAVKTKDLRQGKYRLLINFLPIDASSVISGNPQLGASPVARTGETVLEENPAASKNQFVTLELTLPAARLHSPATIIVEQTVFPFGDYIGSNSTLSLREMSGHQTRLTNLDIKQVEISGGAAVANNSTPLLDFVAPDAIAPSKVGKFPVTSAGDFPLGTTTGVALVTSPQLAEPLLVNFEVRSHRSLWWIPAIIIFGIGLGFAARIWAQRQIELYNARSKADDAIKTLRQEQQRHQDAVFRQKIQDIITTLETARNGRKAEAIVTAITKAETDSAIALQELDARRAQSIGQLENLSKLAAARRGLPQKIAPVFEIESVLNESRKLLASDDISETGRILDELTQRINDTFGEKLSDWIEESKSFLRGLESFSPLSWTASEIFSQTIGGLSSQLDAMMPTGNNLTPENMLTSVNEIHASRLKFRQLLLGTQSSIRETIDSYKKKFEQVEKPDESTLKELFEKLDAFSFKSANWTQTGSEIPPPSVQENIEDLKNAWRKALLNQLATNPETKTSVGNLLDQEDYRAATAATIKFLRENHTDTALGDENVLLESSLTRTEANAAFATGESEETNGTSPLIFTILRESTLPPIFDSFKPGSLSNYVIANLLRFAVAGIGIIAAGYVLFADKFVGTATDLLAVFAWAFALDVSVNTFLDSTKADKNKA